VNRGSDEKTSKFIKMGRIIGRLALFGSFVAMAADVLLNGAANFLLFVLFVVLSAAFLLFLRFSHWWHHE
jgi:hypothetical protein